jgi:hypothetical protein
VTFVWFVIWLAANSFGDSAPLRFDPVNIWAGTLLLAIALDLAHVTSAAGRRGASGGG